MSNESVYLPGKIRDRIQDLMKSRKVTQAELATRIGCSESSLSRFISGKTDKLGDENIIRIARVFNVSTDFLLGEVDTPDRLNYDIAELGLSVQAARNLYTHKVNPGVVNALLENPEFANTTNLISGYLDDELARGFAAQNQLYANIAGMLKSQPEAVDDVKKLQTPTYQAAEQIYLAQERIDDIHHALYMIEERDEQYLRYRYGFDDDVKHPLTETAKHFHLSESRAKKTEALALDNVWLELPWWY